VGGKSIPTDETLGSELTNAQQLDSIARELIEKCQQITTCTASDKLIIARKQQ
jgi:hypothetical protein